MDLESIKQFLKKDFDSQILNAIKNRDVKRIKYIIDYKNMDRHNNNLVLFKLIEMNSKDIIKYYLEHRKVELLEFNILPLFATLKYNNIDILKLLLDNSKFQKTKIYYDLLKSYIDIIRDRQDFLCKIKEDDYKILNIILDNIDKNGFDIDLSFKNNVLFKNLYILSHMCNRNYLLKNYHIDILDRIISDYRVIEKLDLKILFYFYYHLNIDKIEQNNIFINEYILPLFINGYKKFDKTFNNIDKIDDKNSYNQLKYYKNLRKKYIDILSILKLYKSSGIDVVKEYLHI